MAGFIDKEDFVMFYKDFLDYDKQLKAEGKAEGKEESIIYLIEQGMPHKVVEGLAKKSGISTARLAELYKTTEVIQSVS